MTQKRKVFISVLGAGGYRECKYTKDDFVSQPVRFIQEATMDMLQQQTEWNSNDAAYILLTDGAKNANWLDDGMPDKIPGATGLHSRLEAMKLPFKVHTIEELPIGRNEAEIWEIFTRTYAHLQEGDTLYIDLTHGFRSLPMLVVALVNYSQFLKGTTVASITYGIEPRDTSNATPIIDLTPLATLLDWNYAAGQFINNGDITPLQKLSKKVITPIMRNKDTRRNEVGDLDRYLSSLAKFIKELRTCRGKEIISCENLLTAQKYFEKMERELIVPLVPLFERINKSLSIFKTNDTHNTISAARWCFDRGMYQQAVTFLREGIVTILCELNNIDYKAKEQRKIMENVLYLIKENIGEEHWNIDNHEKTKEIVANNSITRETACKYDSTGELRNDINHSGMREKSLSPDKLESNIAAMLQEFEKLFTHGHHACEKKQRKVLLNLSNHPLSTWNVEQKEAAAVYGEIVELPFPAIDDTADTAYIQALANEYLCKIQAMGNNKNTTIHIMGKQTFLYSLLHRLQACGYRCIASTTKRNVEILPDGSEKKSFTFARFREYEQLG